MKVELPKDFKLPEGLQYEFKPDAPEYAKFRDLAVKRGLDQDTITDLVGLFAETQVSSEATFQTAVRAELDKLGANATARVTAIQTFLNGKLGEEHGKALSGAMLSANIVKAFEALVSKFASQGVAPFSQSGRDTPAGNGAIPGYENMSFAQRRAAQDAQRAGR